MTGQSHFPPSEGAELASIASFSAGRTFRRHLPRLEKGAHLAGAQLRLGDKSGPAGGQRLGQSRRQSLGAEAINFAPSVGADPARESGIGRVCPGGMR